MTKLTLQDEAYNATIDALNQAEDELLRAYSTYNQLIRAANALAGEHRGHGKRQAGAANLSFAKR